MKEACCFLGSLTQFTDDLRDYEEDKSNGNANLLISMEKQYDERSRDLFVEWYVREEQNMIEKFKEAGITADIEMLVTIPWHPFFLKRLTS